ncbi:hypothetical protein Pelo_19705 [Pelomyxa schiedti]|nr:hypothetical protein Pelo_19705 [Pelomyxa schiedti]
MSLGEVLLPMTEQPSLLEHCNSLRKLSNPFVYLSPIIPHWPPRQRSSLVASPVIATCHSLRKRPNQETPCQKSPSYTKSSPGLPQAVMASTWPVSPVFRIPFYRVPRGYPPIPFHPAK